MFESVTEGITSTDLNGNVVDVNEATARIHGFDSKEQLIGRSSFELISKRDHARAMENLKKTLEQGHSGTLEYALLRKDGSEFPGELNAALLSDQSGNPTGFVAITRDISERKQVEEALRQSEERYRELADSIADVFFAMDGDLRYTYWNKASEKFTEISAEDALGKHLYDLFPKVEATRMAEEVFINVLRTKQPQSFATQYQLRGKEFFFENNAYPSRSGLAVFMKDITERKRAEEALRIGENALASSINAVAMTDLEGNLSYVNDSFLKMWGYDNAKEVLGKPAVQFWKTEEKALEVVGVLKERGWWVGELTAKGKDGSFFVVHLSTSIVKNEAGKPICRMASFIDITERKQAEEAMKSSRGYLEKLNDSICDTSFTVKMPERVIEYVNRSIKSVFGYEPEECIGKTTAFLYPDKKEFLDFGNKLSSTIEKGKDVLHTEQSLKRKNEEVFTAEIDATFLRENGKITRVISIVRDITERKQAEEVLYQQNEFLGNILNSLTHPFYVIDANDYTLKMVNPAAKAGNLLENPTCYALTHKSGKPCGGVERVCPLTEVKKTKKPVVVEHIHYDEDGNARNVEVHGYPIFDTAGNVIQMIEYCLDITERKQAEERDKQLREELARSSRLAAIGRLAAGVAHEINNPLTGILGFSQRLLRKVTDGKVSQDLLNINNEARRAAEVVKNLLAFARSSKPEKEYAGINDILQKALELRAYELRTGNIEVALELEPSLPDIMVDFGQIQEVFLNIILNAEQVMTEANNVGKLSIKTQQMKNYIRISFTNDGPAIPGEHLDKLFDPFFSTRGERGGTGLGLSICHGIVTEHGGRIYAKSKPERGATFLVELPMTTGK